MFSPCENEESRSISWKIIGFRFYEIFIPGSKQKAYCLRQRKLNCSNVGGSFNQGVHLIKVRQQFFKILIFQNNKTRNYFGYSGFYFY